MKIEEESKKRRTRVNIKKAVLGVIATAGFLSVSALAPNAIQALGVAGGKRRKRIFENSVSRLFDQGFVTFEKTEKGKFLRLTEKGKFELQKLTDGEVKMKRKKFWDGKWRVVIFDIPEARRSDRIKLWRLLKRLGFFRLQDSVWVYSDDCEDIIKMIKADLKLGLAVTYIIADTIEGDGKVAEFFGVKKSWLFAK
jgi:DNA-binding transcriptional regulator PaaX